MTAEDRPSEPPTLPDRWTVSWFAEGIVLSIQCNWCGRSFADIPDAKTHQRLDLCTPPQVKR